MIEAMFFVMGAGLLAYVLTGGADFGGGFWHLIASGPRRKQQRAAIEHAIGPIWEANHVWLIFVIVMMFTAYPRAFAVLSIAFHIPIVVALIGVVLRGASFVFKSYGLGPSAARERWGHVFAWASVVTPIFFGMVLAGTSSGAVQVVGSRVTSGFFAGWTTPFAVLTGGFALSLFALLAAAYLAVDAAAEVRDDFRRRAIVAELVSGFFAASVFVAAARDAPLLRERLSRSTSFWPLQIATGVCALAAVALLMKAGRGRAKAARLLVALQVVLVVVGWGAAMDGELVLGAVSAATAGGRVETLRAVVPALVGGTVLLVPSLYVLFRIFRSGRASSE